MSTARDTAVAGVFVIDDSALVRQTVAHLLHDAPGLRLLGWANDPLEAEAQLRAQRPDVLLLDIDMPHEDGLSFLRRLMATDPIPTVICSGLVATGNRKALEALAAGAVAIVAKPHTGVRGFLEGARHELIRTLSAAARARPRPAAATTRAAAPAAGTPTAGPAAGGGTRAVVIGASTGGAQAVEQVLLALGADAPPLAIVQHMPEQFTAMYAQRLDQLCALEVREARDGDRLRPGLALIAPGGRHLQLAADREGLRAQVGDGPTVNRHRPSVDVLFRSAAACAGARLLGILMTGMGDDGARGLLRLAEAGAATIAQDEASCVVFGMPAAAIQLGAAGEVLPLGSIADAIRHFAAA